MVGVGCYPTVYTLYMILVSPTCAAPSATAAYQTSFVCLVYNTSFVFHFIFSHELF